MKKILSFLLTSVFFLIVYAHPSQALLTGFVSGCMSAPGWTGSGHSVDLSIAQGGLSHPATNTDTWVFVCVTRGTDTYCSTAGDGSADKLLFGMDNTNPDSHYQKLKGMVNGGYIGGVMNGAAFDNQNPPRKTNNDASNPQFDGVVTWGDAYYPMVVHQWSWVQQAAPTDGTGAVGDQAAQHQATLIFQHLSEDTKNCVPIGWDPRGVVFDVNTLYPVKGLQIELYKKNDTTGIYDFVPNRLGLANPTSTSNANGQYSFFVDAGWYKLKLRDPGTSIAPLTTSQMATAKNFFTDTKGDDHIYSNDTPIQEQTGSVAIANIPVNVTDNAMLVKDLTVIDNVDPTVEGGDIRLFGRVSHPRSKMIITMDMLDANGTVKQFVKTDSTDGLGEYDKLISQTVDSTEPLVFQKATLTFELNSFYTTGIFSKKDTHTDAITHILKDIWSAITRKIDAHAATTSKSTIIIQPIPTYLEGIAYDLSGKPIPKAIVGVYVSFSENPVYLTVADENGRYKIGSQHLPRFEYTLRYRKTTGEVVQVDTSTFIKQNAKLLIAENIKPFDTKQTTLAEDKKIQAFFATTSATTDLKLVGGGQKNGSGGSSKPSSRKGQSGDTTQTGFGALGTGMQGIIMIAVVIMVLVMIGVGAFLMMKSKQSQMPPQY